MTETSKPSEARLSEVAATDSAGCNWAASVASNPLFVADRDGLERLYEANREILEFWRDRIERFGDATQRFVACRSIEEMQQIQSRYLQDMLRAHAAMWSKLPALFFARPTARETPSAAQRPTRVA